MCSSPSRALPPALCFRPSCVAVDPGRSSPTSGRKSPSNPCTGPRSRARADVAQGHSALKPCTSCACGGIGSAASSRLAGLALWTSRRVTPGRAARGGKQQSLDRRAVIPALTGVAVGVIEPAEVLWVAPIGAHLPERGALCRRTCMATPAGSLMRVTPP